MNIIVELTPNEAANLLDAVDVLTEMKKRLNDWDDEDRRAIDSAYDKIVMAEQAAKDAAR